MKKIFIFFVFILHWINSPAGTLVEVYQEALQKDPVFLQSVLQYASTKENIPIIFSSFLPHISLNATPFVYKSAGSGPGNKNIGSYSQRGFKVNMIATKTLIDFSQFSDDEISKIRVNQANEQLHSSKQELMIRVANSYYTILIDEENLKYEKSNLQFQDELLGKVKEEYQLGLKNVSDVDSAKAAHDLSLSKIIESELRLNQDNENLRTITGNLEYIPFKKHLFLVDQKPDYVEKWVEVAMKKNNVIQAMRYENVISMLSLKKQREKIYPVLTAEAIYNINFSRNTGGNILQPKGANQTHNHTFELTLSLPILSGGQDDSEMRQAQYQYQITSQHLIQVIRETIQSIRQYHKNIISLIQKINSDKQAIQSARYAFIGIKERYKMGLATLIDLLSQQDKLLETEKVFISDQYNYIKNVLLLKQAAGVLDQNDLV